MAGELTVSRRSDESEQRVENRGHGGMVINGYRGTCFHFRCTPLRPSENAPDRRSHAAVERTCSECVTGVGFGGIEGPIRSRWRPQSS